MASIYLFRGPCRIVPILPYAACSDMQSDKKQ